MMDTRQSIIWLAGVALCALAAGLAGHAALTLARNG